MAEAVRERETGKTVCWGGGHQCPNGHTRFSWDIGIIM